MTVFTLMGGGGAEGAATGWAAPLLVLTITAKKEAKENKISSKKCVIPQQSCSHHLCIRMKFNKIYILCAKFIQVM